MPDLVFQHLGHQSVQGPTAGRDRLQNARAVFIRFDLLGNTLQLATKATDPSKELAFVPMCMCHGVKYTILGYITRTLAGLPASDTPPACTMSAVGFDTGLDVTH